ncbi:MAG: hypothetical protein HZA16_08395 [Nitrospirae bacterium]|nr:hypothetical protein [Nitrospirota bacterium]
MLGYLKEGFRLANRNIGLVFIRMFAGLINVLGLLFCLGLPAVVAVLYLSFDLAHVDRLLPYFTDRPLDFLSRYMGFLFFLGLSVISYLLFASIVIIYSLGGVLGALRNSAVSEQYRLSLSSFFREANKNFPRLFRLVFIESLMFGALVSALLAAGAAAVSAARDFSGSGSLPEVFMNSFALLTIAVFGLIVFFLSLVFMIISAIVSATEGRGSRDTLKKTTAFLKKNPQAFLFSLILLTGVIAANAGQIIIKLSFPMFFGGGFLLLIAGAVLQNYLTVAAWSCLLVYYLKMTCPDYSSPYEI